MLNLWKQLLFVQGEAILAPTAVIPEETQGWWGGRLVICLGGRGWVFAEWKLCTLIFFADHPFLKRDQIFIYWYFLFSVHGISRKSLSLPCRFLRYWPEKVWFGANPLWRESSPRGRHPPWRPDGCPWRPTVFYWQPLREHWVASIQPFVFFWTVLKTFTEETIATNFILMCSDVTT